MTEDFARKTKDIPNNQLIGDVLEVFSKIFPKDSIKLRDAIVTRWSNDEFTLGSYSFGQVGSCEKDVEILRSPIDERIWLMGEHVS